MGTPNVELLTRTLEAIEQNPKDWYQGSWVAIVDNDGEKVWPENWVDNQNECRTACCFAGQAAVLSGIRQPSVKEIQALGYGDWYVSKTGETIWSTKYSTPSGAETVSSWAQEALGLTSWQSEILFEGDNTLRDLRKLVDLIISGDLENDEDYEVNFLGWYNGTEDDCE